MTRRRKILLSVLGGVLLLALWLAMRKPSFLIVTFLCLITLVALTGCVSTPESPPQREVFAVHVLRLTAKADYQTIIGGLWETIPHTFIRFKVEAPEKFAGKEFDLNLLDGSEETLFERDHFILMLTEDDINGVTTEDWIGKDGQKHTWMRGSYNLDGILKEEK